MSYGIVQAHNDHAMQIISVARVSGTSYTALLVDVFLWTLIWMAENGSVVVIGSRK